MVVKPHNELNDRIIESCRALVGSSCPVDVEAIARRLGVVEISARTMQVEGYLARRPDNQFAIRYRHGSTIERVRFTIAHEIGHILIADATGVPLDTAVARGPNRTDVVEKLANRCAAELLMPERAVLALLGGLELQWHQLHDTATELNVSVSALARRLPELTTICGFELRVPVQQPVNDSRAYFTLPTGRRVLLLEHPSQLAHRLRREMSKRTLHTVLFDLNGVQVPVRMAGRIVRNDGSATYHLIGACRSTAQGTHYRTPDLY